MDIILAICTVLGGISALIFFWEKIPPIKNSESVVALLARLYPQKQRLLGRLIVEDEMFPADSPETYDVFGKPRFKSYHIQKCLRNIRIGAAGASVQFEDTSGKREYVAVWQLWKD